MQVDSSSHHGSFDAGSSARVTRLGSFLRRFKIDELPQLVNVLKGEMSLVGPRPEIAMWIEAYPEKWQEVLAVRPGITDWASIVYRHEEEILAKAADPVNEYRNEVLPGKLKYYMEYAADVRFRKDAVIIFNTIKSLVKKQP